MKISYYHYIKSLVLPEDWAELESVEVGRPVQTVRSFAPKNDPDVKIELFYRGLPVSEAATIVLRKTLALAPKLIFDWEFKDQLSASDLQLMGELKEILGNVGNNQIVNQRQGRRGAPFMLLRLEALVWNDKPVLAARGYFKNPEDNTRVSEFCGFFIDANPKDASCQIEEIYLQAPNENLQLKYLPVFKQCVSSLEWRIK